MMRIVETDGDLVVLSVAGRVEKADYDRVVPELERGFRAHGRLRAIVRLGELKGMAPAAMVEEFRFDLKHRDDFVRCAVVGERTWHAAMARLGELFFRCPVRFFDADQEHEARAWVQAPEAAAEGGG